jgi:hypothetical protein
MKKIEKNIPVQRNGYRTNPCNNLADEMEIGDSILCENQKELTDLRHAIDRLDGCKPFQRKQEDNIWRVWKIKHEKN